MVAPNRAVAAPVQEITPITRGKAWKRGSKRATRKIPAATILAAWIKAEIGVGPSILSGNNSWSQNCTDSATRPQNSKCHYI